MKIAFLHPDLGLGGAERLVVDAATGLVELGHTVDVYTSHYEAKRSFAETRTGAFGVHVHGDWLPTSVLGGFHIVAALLRSAWLAVVVALTAPDADVFVCDQVSICVPILRLLRPTCGVLFYCHFPDMLLSKRSSVLKALYRWPFDTLEQACTAVADVIVVNSKFTRAVFQTTFRSITTPPVVLYPCINVLGGGGAAAVTAAAPQADPRVLLSINRFERKKGIDVAVRAFASLVRRLGASPRVHLVVAGGYDERVAENIQHYDELVAVAREEGLIGDALLSSAAAISRVLTVWPREEGSSAGKGYDTVQVGRHITFIRSFTDAQKAALLGMAAAVVYTPQNEHFGIVPLECMASRRPVLACASGGPLESVVHGETGYLCEPTPQAFSKAMEEVVSDPAKAARMGEAGLRHVAGTFSRPVFAAHLELELSRVTSARRKRRSICQDSRHWGTLVLLVLALPAVVVAAVLLAPRVWAEATVLLA